MTPDIAEASEFSKAQFDATRIMVEVERDVNGDFAEWVGDKNLDIILAALRIAASREAPPSALDAFEQAKARIEELQAETRLLSEFGKHVGWELTWGEIDNDLSDCAWRVHECSGGLNDREWRLLATGDTPTDAIRSALTGATP